MVTAEQQDSILVVNAVSGEVERTLATEQAVSHMLALSKDHTRAFVANIGSGSMTVVDLVGRKNPASYKTGEGAEGIAVSPDGKEVWVTNRAADTVTVIDTSTLEIKARLEAASFPIRATFTPDGGHVLVSCARSGELVAFDAKTRKEAYRLSMRARAGDDKEGRLFKGFGGSPVPVGVLVDPAGKLAYVANTNADLITVIDLEKRAIVGRLKAGKEPDGMAYAVLH